MRQHLLNRANTVAGRNNDGPSLTNTGISGAPYGLSRYDTPPLGSIRINKTQNRDTNPLKITDGPSTHETGAIEVDALMSGSTDLLIPITSTRQDAFDLVQHEGTLALYSHQARVKESQFYS
jgi:hypothetical protein